MSKIRAFSGSLSLAGALAFLLQAPLSQARQAADFSFLDSLERGPVTWTRERTPPLTESFPEAETDLSAYYQDFHRDGKVTIYVGYGYEAWFPERAPTLYQMLVELGNYYGLPLKEWRVNDEATRISFRNAKTGVKYEITVGHERNDYIKAFSSHEVVMYHGHSRYGRGPAFGSFTNYFRMGNVFDSIEVDTRNSYFQKEPILKTELYPLRSVDFGSGPLPYQYRGQKVDSSYLPANAYTKVIPGGDVDLKQAQFSPGRQIFYFYSCKNRKYWRESIRALLPDPQQKFVFGTKEDAWGGTKPAAVMIMSVVMGLTSSGEIVSDLNATQDCANCFTTY